MDVLLGTCQYNSFMMPIRGRIFIFICIGDEAQQDSTMAAALLKRISFRNHVIDIIFSCPHYFTLLRLLLLFLAITYLARKYHIREISGACNLIIKLLETLYEHVTLTTTLFFFFSVKTDPHDYITIILQIHRPRISERKFNQGSS